MNSGKKQNLANLYNYQNFKFHQIDIFDLNLKRHKTINILNYCQILMLMNLIKNFRIKKFGIKEFPNCGTVDEVLKSHNLDEYSLSRNILNFIKNKK